MNIYYLNTEYEPGKHKILKTWSEKFLEPKPEESSKTAINVPYTVLEIDERYNGLLCKNLANNARDKLPDRYYVDNDGKLYSKNGVFVTINPNPEKESYKLSPLYGLTQEQLATYIDNNVTTLTTAKEFLKKLSAVVLWLVKQSKLG